MAELKTQKNKASVKQFLASIEDPVKRKDCKTLEKLMAQITGCKAEMWGTSMVGFGSYHYTYASGREGDWFLCGFAPRKQALTVYIMDGFKGYPALMKKLGRHKTGKSCLYLSQLEDVDQAVLAELIKGSVTAMREKYPGD
jgi:hypothetical protein